MLDPARACFSLGGPTADTCEFADCGRFSGEGEEMKHSSSDINDGDSTVGTFPNVKAGS